MAEIVGTFTFFDPVTSRFNQKGGSVMRQPTGNTTLVCVLALLACLGAGSIALAQGVVLPPTTKVLDPTSLQFFIPPELPCSTPAFWIPPELPIGGPWFYIPPELPCASPYFFIPPELPVGGPWFYIPPELPCMFPPPPELPCFYIPPELPCFLIPPELPCLFPPPPELPCGTGADEVLRFKAMTPVLASLSPGDVIAAGVTPQTPLGLLRRVVKVQQGSSGIEVGVLPATLEDAIEQGSLQHCGDLRGRRFRVFDGTQNVYPFDGTEVLMPFSFEVTGPQGQRARFAGRVSLGSNAGLGYCVTLGLDYGRVHSFQFNTTLDVTMVLDTIAADGDVEFAREFEVARVLFEPETIPAGGLPIVLAPEIGVFVRVEGSLNAGFKASLRQAGVVGAGASYANGEWTPMRKFTTSYAFNPTGVPGTAKFVASVKPQVALKLYGLPGPVAGYELDAIPAVNPADAPWWRLYGGLKAAAAVDTGALGCSLGDQQWPLIDWSALVATASAAPGIPIAGTVRTTAGAALAGVALTGLPGAPSTNYLGQYKATVPYGWSGTVSPMKGGWTFKPPTRSYSHVVAGIAGQDYVAIRTPMISGYVRTRSGAGVIGVEMRVAPSPPGAPVVTTNAAGFYSVTVPNGWSGTVTPYRPGSAFGPPFRAYTNVTSNLPNQQYLMTQGTLPQ